MSTGGGDLGVWDAGEGLGRAGLGQAAGGDGFAVGQAGGVSPWQDIIGRR